MDDIFFSIIDLKKYVPFVTIPSQPCKTGALGRDKIFLRFVPSVTPLSCKLPEPA